MFDVGDIVQSHFRSTWTGVVVARGSDHGYRYIGRMGHRRMFSSTAVNRDNRPAKAYVNERGVAVYLEPYYFLGKDNVLVMVTHDRCGNKLRKHIWKRMHITHLTRVGRVAGDIS